ncbi:hypothetical protein YOLOSWAG_59 [Erwinia phage vB_EamM_Yoloswag]|uniref:Uncharacterized protein n=1 Tax=Erwinia phage vB_EamM_Yoloswag TaxID=1958956 RepID=A0A1S6L2Y6_9CAUD|nr:hypothetical protein HOR66_gp059 [Erwinia phage vB_EamM_Yoloswag]AQT28542.1 hypothetical protein YOLOSWAG_59 [Erwinia phage vB_EamM_Yoloswag]
MIYDVDGIDLKRMHDGDREFSLVRLSHIIACLESGVKYTAVGYGKMLAEIQNAHHQSEPFKTWLYDELESHYATLSEGGKELMFDTKDLIVRQQIYNSKD